MDNLIQQLMKIECQPQNEWKESTRNFLMAQIRQDDEGIFEKKESFILRIAEGWQSMRLAWQPVAIFALSALFVIGSSGWVVVAAEDSVPGQNLFVVKRAIEKVKNYMVTDTIRQTELASSLLDRRVNELEKALYMETKLVASGGKSEQKTVVAAVTEIKKQLDDVDNKLLKMQGETNEKSREAVAAALELNQKIATYHRELKEAKDKVSGQVVEEELNKAILRAEDINSNVLAVIVENHEKGVDQVSSDELAQRLGEHVKQLEEKAAEVVAAVSPVNYEQKEILEKTNQIQEDIAKAKKAITDNEYKLVLTLARSTNETLKVLYGEIYQIYSSKTETAEEEPEKSEEAGEVLGENTTSTEKVIEPKIIEEIIKEEEKPIEEFEVGIQ